MAVNYNVQGSSNVDVSPFVNFAVGARDRSARRNARELSLSQAKRKEEMLQEGIYQAKNQFAKVDSPNFYNKFNTGDYVGAMNEFVHMQDAYTGGSKDPSNLYKAEVMAYVPEIGKELNAFSNMLHNKIITVKDVNGKAMLKPMENGGVITDSNKKPETYQISLGEAITVAANNYDVANTLFNEYSSASSRLMMQENWKNKNGQSKFRVFNGKLLNAVDTDTLNRTEARVAAESARIAAFTPGELQQYKREEAKKVKRSEYLGVIQDKFGVDIAQSEKMLAAADAIAAQVTAQDTVQGMVTHAFEYAKLGIQVFKDTDSSPAEQIKKAATQAAEIRQAMIDNDPEFAKKEAIKEQVSKNLLKSAENQGLSLEVEGIAKTGELEVTKRLTENSRKLAEMQSEYLAKYNAAKEPKDYDKIQHYKISDDQELKTRGIDLPGGLEDYINSEIAKSSTYLMRTNDRSKDPITRNQQKKTSVRRRSLWLYNKMKGHQSGKLQNKTLAEGYRLKLLEAGTMQQAKEDYETLQGYVAKYGSASTVTEMSNNQKHIVKFMTDLSGKSPVFKEDVDQALVLEDLDTQFEKDSKPIREAMGIDSALLGRYAEMQATRNARAPIYDLQTEPAPASVKQPEAKTVTIKSKDGKQSVTVDARDPRAEAALSDPSVTVE